MRKRCSATSKPVKTTIKLLCTKAKTPLDIRYKIYIIEAFEQHLNNILEKEIELEYVPTTYYATTIIWQNN